MKILLGLSGGIDSSVAAHLLKKQGHEIIGIYMKMHNQDHSKNLENIEYLSKKLDIPYYVEDITKIFEEKVKKKYIEDYKKGIMPNPCIICNKDIKFGIFASFLEKYNADKIASGHYVKTDGKFLYTAKDWTRDQTFFLSYINVDILKNTIFPLGNLYKKEVKHIAQQIGLKKIATQNESTGVCFINGYFGKFLSKNIIPKQKIGTVIYDKTGKSIGRHKGFFSYTIGQKKGIFYNKEKIKQLNINVKNLCVIDIKPKENIIVVGNCKQLQQNKFLVEINFHDKSLQNNKKNLVYVSFENRGQRYKSLIIKHKNRYYLQILNNDFVKHGLQKGSYFTGYLTPSLFEGNKVLLGGRIIKNY
jgi:tRNA-specific 2-thiouridylase